jgi:hypothetical protein
MSTTSQMTLPLCCCAVSRAGPLADFSMLVKETPVFLEYGFW